MLKYKHIEASREVRLWLGQVIIPAVSAGMILISNPTVREYVDKKYNNMKAVIENKFKK